MTDWHAEPAIVHDITLECLDIEGRVGLVDAALTYDPEHPFAVTVVFRAVGESVPWTFARELLEAGTDAPSGTGDVHVWPSIDGDARAVTVLELHSPDGSFVAHARTAQVRAFLDRTHALVPAGDETDLLGLDDVISRLLAV